MKFRVLTIRMVGCELEEKERFWSELDEVMESIPTGERVVIGADFNGHVGEGNRGDEVMGKFGVKERNLEGQMVVDFAKRMDMAVVNTYFQKREEHRVTYKSGGRRTQVVLPDDWETTAEVIRETGRKVLGVSSGRRKEDKETWWWNEEVQDSVQRKRLAKKKWDMDRTEENRQEYKELQCRVKREVSKAKQKAYDELYTRKSGRIVQALEIETSTAAEREKGGGSDGYSKEKRKEMAKTKKKTRGEERRGEERRGEERRGEEWRGEERRGEERRGEEWRGEEWRGEERRGEERRGEERSGVEWEGRGEERRGEERRGEARRGEARRGVEWSGRGGEGRGGGGEGRGEERRGEGGEERRGEEGVEGEERREWRERRGEERRGEERGGEERRGVEWRGEEWSGEERRGEERRGEERSGVEWRGVEWSGVERRGEERRGVERGGEERRGVEGEGEERRGEERRGVEWRGEERSGVEWREGEEWSGEERRGEEWRGEERRGERRGEERRGVEEGEEGEERRGEERRGGSGGRGEGGRERRGEERREWRGEERRGEEGGRGEEGEERRGGREGGRGGREWRRKLLRMYFFKKLLQVVVDLEPILGPLGRLDYTLDGMTLPGKHLHPGPQHLIEKLSLLGLNTSLCNWILDFLTGRPQSVRIGDSLSSTNTLSTGAPQGCVLSTLLFTLLTHDCAAMHSSNHIVKFTDDMTVVGLISKNDESAYREEVQQLTAWCKANSLSLNVDKTKEMVADFRRAQSDHSPLFIDGSPVEIVKSSKFLGVHLAENFTWSLNTTSHHQEIPVVPLLPAEAEESPSTSIHPDHVLQRDH
ncbi:hypothetical protein QTP70_012125 [Hemibagrus guttatus]|uniref:Reverse transcriptase domain-containing protein n=1 Tax=Hemibagrus guttatus TaxID=175788 RepID=A0AAE0QZF7_9TELE|nr:hypothetical protein QTP70_012125 [Hemibagrus guttatus]